MCFKPSTLHIFLKGLEHLSPANLISHLQAAIQETTVLPKLWKHVHSVNAIAERDDWVPWNVAPFIRINYESKKETSNSIDTNNHPSVSVKARLEASAWTLSDAESSQEPARKSDSLALLSSSSCSMTLRSSKSLEQLTTPLLENDKP